MISGPMILALLAILVVIWLVFYVIPLPPPVRTGLGVVLAIILVLWVLVLTGLVNF